jgi:hypothetical protein
VLLKNGKISGVFENSPNKYRYHIREKKNYSEENEEKMEHQQDTESS